MATIALQYPTLSPTQPQNVASETQPFLVYAGNTVNDSGLVIVDSSHAGYVTEPSLSAGTTPYNTGGATIYGLAMHSSAAVFVPPASGTTKYNTPFGVYSNSNTALIPTDPRSLKVALFHKDAEFEFSLDTGISLTQSLIGSAIGLASTGSSNGDIWYATTTNTGSCLCATIVRIVEGPGYGVIGTDSGGRLVVKFLSTFLVL